MHLHRLISLAAALTAPAALPATAQPDLLAGQTIPIRSIDPGDDDFADLEPLIALIGEARVVQLGEQTHGDGAAFLAKVRLVKFLHQRMGFDVLVWESGMFDCRVVDDKLREGVPTMDAHAHGVFGIWRYSAQVRPLLDYVADSHATDRPIATAGMDTQFTSDHGTGEWARRVRALFADAGVPPSPDADAALRFFAPAGGEAFSAVIAGEIGGDTKRGLEALAMDAAASRPARVARHGEPEADFFARVIDDMREWVRFAEANARGASMNNIRDARMGDNLAWLADEYYKGRRLIVWEATMHAVHRACEIETGLPFTYDGLITAGERARSILGDAVFTVGFTAARGTAARLGMAPSRLEAPREGSLEAAALATGRRFLWIDFRSAPPDHPLRARFSARPLGYAPMHAVWPDQMDAMFYTEEMFPSTAERTHPPTYRLRVEPADD
ncbi:MAG: erythromycin esterase family protein [Phycisphaeraceae bacterium]|nr:erythromycin esterase family protein [Phycisphaeraceae bacterium]